MSLRTSCVLLVLLAGLGGACERSAGSTQAQPAETQPVPEQVAKATVAKVVFVDQEQCCDCTRARIDASWASLQQVLGVDTKLPVERVHMDTQETLAEPYRKMKPMQVAPAVYFLDDKGGLIAMLQGELSPDQIKAVVD